MHNTNNMKIICTIQRVILPSRLLHNYKRRPWTSQLLIYDQSNSIELECNVPNIGSRWDGTLTVYLSHYQSDRYCFLDWIWQQRRGSKLCYRLMVAENLLSPVRLLYVIMFILPPIGRFRHSSHAYHEKIIYSCSTRVNR